jgi:hypothetical protein
VNIVPSLWIERGSVSVAEKGPANCRRVFFDIQLLTLRAQLTKPYRKRIDCREARMGEAITDKSLPGYSL